MDVAEFKRKQAARRATKEARVRFWRAVRHALAILVVAKLALAGASLRGAMAGAATAPAPDLSRLPTSASQAAPDAHPALAPVDLPSADAAKGKSLETQSLLEAVARRQAELDEREKQLAAREQKLALYESDVTAKVTTLEALEKRLAEKVKASNAAMDNAAQSLAKVYAAMKPQEAAPILEHLDEETVIRIFGRMKEKQIGEILPLMARDKAIVLTRSLAESH
jgi:flagellar motility protein MotE (MotC chaperone)